MIDYVKRSSPRVSSFNDDGFDPSNLRSRLNEEDA